MTTAFLPQLKEAKGAVINIGSIQSFVALPNSAAYTTSKGGVRALTKALAIELSPLGVRVNAIGPGLIATPLNAKARENPAYMKNFEGRIPLGASAHPRTSRRSPCSSPPIYGALHHRHNLAGRRRLSGLLKYANASENPMRGAS